MESKFKKLQLGLKDSEKPTPDDDDLQLTDYLKMDSSDEDEEDVDASLLETSCEMEFSNGLDDEMQVEGGPKKRKNHQLSKTERQIEKQNELIQKALKMGLKT